MEAFEFRQMKSLKTKLLNKMFNKYGEIIAIKILLYQLFQTKMTFDLRVKFRKDYFHKLHLYILAKTNLYIRVYNQGNKDKLSIEDL